ncbi:Blasticidin-S deaminase, partial [Lachnellula willkommii]
TCIDAVPRFTERRTTTDHTVAAATLASDGRIFTGINVPHWSGGPCAENVMFANAVAAGASSAMVPGILDARGESVVLTHVVAVASDDRGVISPCGRCRQMMFDYYPEIRVIVKDDGGELRTVGVKELLPFAYDIKGVRKAGDPAKLAIDD